MVVLRGGVFSALVHWTGVFLDVGAGCTAHVGPSAMNEHVIWCMLLYQDIESLRGIYSLFWCIVPFSVPRVVPR